MSLFGGDSSAPPTESEYESGSDHPPSAVAQSAPNATLKSPPSAQIPHAPLEVRDAAAEDVAQDITGNDADREESDEEEPERTNRFKGPPQTWRGYTATDRQIVESLQQIEDADLAAHLYNAHALKRRARRPVMKTSTLDNWQNKDAWLKQGDELQYKDATGQLQTELVPAKDWTAWPLAPTSLLDPDNGSREATTTHEEGEWVIGVSGTLDPGEELKEEVLGLFLRLAKDNWSAKGWQDDVRRSLKKSARSGLRSRAQSAQPDIDMKDGKMPGPDVGKEETGQEGGAKRGRKVQVEPDIKPVVLADDAKAQRLLRPTIASLLNSLDDVALGLQRTRLNHFGRGGFGEGSSQSEFTTDAETMERESMSRSQSRARSTTQSKPVTRQSSRPSSSRASRAPKSPKNFSIPAVDPEDSDSASDYGAQFARDHTFGSAASRSPAIRRKRSRSGSTAEEEGTSNTRDWSRAGLMDWSEVLGIAAVKGWNQKALARTAKRCAALFGEGMTFMPFHEDLASKPMAELVRYTPSTIPAPNLSIAGAPRPAKRPYWQVGALRCPHPDCYGHQKDFRWSYRVIEHCVRIHGYDPRTNDSENEERQCGGVHTDGFLQPISAKQGWLGHGRSKAGGKKRRIGETDLAHAILAEGAKEEDET